MKSKIALSSALLVLLFAFFVNCESSSETLEAVNMPEKQWADYKLQHNKSYDDEEDKRRFEVFKATLKTIAEHNAKYERGETTFKMGLNHMSDWFDEERSKMFGGLRQPPAEQK